MTVKRLAGILLAGGLVFVGTLFFFDSQTRSVESHRRALNELRLLKEADGRLTQDVLRSRFGMLSSYDSLSRSLDTIKARKNDFWQAAGVAYGTARERFRPQVERLEQTLAVKAGLVEDFKSRNAVLKNSQSYVPLASEQLNRLSQDHPELTHDIQLHAPIRQVLLYELTGDPQYVPRLRAALKSLTVVGAKNPDASPIW